MALNELGFRGGFLEKLEHGIEPLDVADLQDEVFLLGNFAQLGGLRGIVRDGFLDEHVFAGGEQLLRDFVMRGGGRGDVQRVAGSGGLGDGGEDF